MKRRLTNLSSVSFFIFQYHEMIATGFWVGIIFLFITSCVDAPNREFVGKNSSCLGSVVMAIFVEAE